MDYKDYKLSAQPSPQDDRDYKITRVASLIPAKELPNKALLTYGHDVKNQGYVGKCVAEAITEAREFVEEQQLGSYSRLSEDYVYANRLSTDYQGSGMVPRQALAQLLKYGIPKYDSFNYDGKEYEDLFKLLTPLKENLDKEAYPHKITGYYRINSLTEYQNAIVQNISPVIIMIGVTDAFYSLNKYNYYYNPKVNDYVTGYHMVCGFGYDGIKAIILNSWGQAWGNNGFFEMDVTNPHIMEMWGITDTMLYSKVIKLTINSNKMDINNDNIMMDVAPFISEGRTMVPVRFIAEALGYGIEWNGFTQAIKFSNGKDVVQMKVNDKNYLINGNNYTMDVYPVITNNRTFVPVRFLAEAFGVKVEWNDALKEVSLFQK